MGAGNNKNGHEPSYRKADLSANQKPSGQCNKASRDSNNGQIKGRSVREYLKARFGRLRLGNQAHNPREKCLLSNMSDSDLERSVAVDRPRNHHSPLFFGDRL